MLEGEDEMNGNDGQREEETVYIDLYSYVLSHHDLTDLHD